MSRDPVCHKEVEDGSASESWSYGGQEYHFCSADCRRRFEKNPDLFLGPGRPEERHGVSCLACGNETSEPIFNDGRGPYCCEQCAFRDLFLGNILDRIESTYLSTMEAFAAAIDAREHETGDHSYRVTQFAMVLGRQTGVADRELVQLYCGALLHDLGKIGIPDAILLKEGPLTAAEQRTMSTHPDIGYRIISRIGYLAGAAEIIRSHHEHFDGSGYPRGLKGEDIPFGSRIFSICDNLDALTVDRPYHKAISFNDAAAYIESASGRLFDPALVAAFNLAKEQLQGYVDKIVI